MDTQLAAMATEGQRVKGKEEDSANVSHIEDRKRVPGKTSQLTCSARGQSCRKCGLEGHFKEAYSGT